MTKHWIKSKQTFINTGKWLGVNHPIVLARKYRKFLLETRINQCVLCNLQEWMGYKIPLVLDHIDGNPENWALDNLRLICHNCDALQPTFKNKNRGNGRTYRRKNKP